MAIFRSLVVLLIASPLLLSCMTPMERYSRETSRSYEIRVKLKNISIPLKIRNNKDINIVDVITKKDLKTAKNDDIIMITNNNKLYINEILIESPIMVYSTKNRLIYINERAYFGEITIYPSEPVVIINTIPIETYLLSVLPSEVPVSFELEAMKAQVIIARTYSYYFMQKNKDRQFDVDDTTAYQVYNGFASLSNAKIAKKIYKSVRNTQNLIIKYNNSPIIAYFHSNSGGKTKSGKEYFGNSSDFEYLIAKDDPYSVDLPGYSWDYSMNKNDFLQIFDVSRDIDVNIILKDEKVSQIHANGRDYSPKQIRKTIGYTKIKSETFSIDMTDDVVKLIGYGYGHGVGLSQWGANRMAQKGFKYEEIISFYYPSAKIDSF